jgi:hypothetical protein
MVYVLVLDEIRTRMFESNFRIYTNEYIYSLEYPYVGIILGDGAVRGKLWSSLSKRALIHFNNH